MLQSTLSNVKRIVKDLQIVDEIQLDNFLELLNLYEKDTFIHPGSIMNKINIDSPTAYKILKELVKNRILEINFQYYCYTCRSFNGYTYFSIEDAVSECFCEHCDKELSKDKNIVVVYRVVS